MRIAQRSHSTSTVFVLTADTLTFTRKDSYGSHTLEAPYGSIGMDPRHATERNGTLFSGAIILFLWGLAHATHLMINGDPWGLLFLIPAPLCLAMHAASTMRITYLNSDAGEIALLHDKNHDLLMTEIRERRKKQLLDWYGNINFANDPDDEIKKFHWLHSQNLITEDQLQRIVTTIRNADHSGLDEYDEPTPPRQ